MRFRHKRPQNTIYIERELASKSCNVRLRLRNDSQLRYTSYVYPPRYRFQFQVPSRVTGTPVRYLATTRLEMNRNLSREREIEAGRFGRRNPQHRRSRTGLCPSRALVGQQLVDSRRIHS